MRLLDATVADKIETTLLIIPHMLADFEEYNQFIDPADALLQQFGWQGYYQIASFHPHYRFAGTRADAAENLTNCSPYPILHILREASIEKVLQNYPAPEKIPERNINRIRRLTLSEKRKCFPYLLVAK